MSETSDNSNENKQPKQRFLLPDVEKITVSDSDRIRAWMVEKIKKYESKLDLKRWQPGAIVAADSVEPEAIDVWIFYKNIYYDLRWYIFRDTGIYKNCFSIMLAGIKKNLDGSLIEHPLCKRIFAKT